jgi:hypothetical protein
VYYCAFKDFHLCSKTYREHCSVFLLSLTSPMSGFVVDLEPGQRETGPPVAFSMSSDVIRAMIVAWRLQREKRVRGTLKFARNDVDEAVKLLISD